MAEVTLDPLDPGDSLDAASINDLMDGVRLAVNDVEPDALAPGALNHNHLPSLVRESAQVVVGGIAPNTHVYTGSSYLPITQGGTDLRIDLASTYPFTADIGGAFVCVGIQVEVNTHGYVIFIIESMDTFGVWIPITRSERMVSQENLHVSIRTLIHAGDLSWASKIRVVVKPGVAAASVTLRDCSLSVLILHGARE